MYYEYLHSENVQPITAAVTDSKYFVPVNRLSTRVFPFVAVRGCIKEWVSSFWVHREYYSEQGPNKSPELLCAPIHSQIIEKKTLVLYSNNASIKDPL